MASEWVASCGGGVVTDWAVRTACGSSMATIAVSMLELHVAGQLHETLVTLYRSLLAS